MLTREPSQNQDPGIWVLKKNHRHKFRSSIGHLVESTLRIEDQRTASQKEKGEMRMINIDTLSSKWHCWPQTFPGIKWGLKNLKKASLNGRYHWGSGQELEAHLSKTKIETDSWFLINTPKLYLYNCFQTTLFWQ